MKIILSKLSEFLLGTSHCANMYPSSETDLPQLTEARVTVKAYLKEMLMEDDLVDSA